MNYQGNNIEGWMSDEELQYLYNQATQMRNIVEIGCWLGRSSHALLSGCKGSVICIDHFIGSPEDETKEIAGRRDILSETKKNIGNFKNLTLLKMDSRDAIIYFPDYSIDMIFIDGGHDEDSIRKDSEIWFPKCRKLFCGHDIHFPGVNKVISEKFRFTNPAGNIWEVKI